MGILGIINLVKNLGVLYEVSRPMVDGIQQLLTKKKRGLKETERIDDLEKAMSLQAQLNEEHANQIRVIQSGLEKIEKSLKILVYALTGIFIVSLAAIVLAILK